MQKNGALAPEVRFLSLLQGSANEFFSME